MPSSQLKKKQTLKEKGGPKDRQHPNRPPINPGWNKVKEGEKIKKKGNHFSFCIRKKKRRASDLFLR